MGIHGREQGLGACDVDIPVQQRSLDGLANGFQSCEMDDGVKGVIAGGGV